MAISSAELAILVKVYDEASGNLDKIERSSGNLLSTVKTLTGVIIGAGAAFAVFALDKAIEQTVTLGEEVRKLTLQTGLSSEAASHILYAGQVTGTAFESISKGLDIFAKNLAGAGQQSEAESARLADAQQRSADTVFDAQKRMQDATVDAQQRISDVTADATLELKRAYRDRTDAIKDANQQYIISTRDAARAVLDAQNDVGAAVRQGARDQRDANQSVITAERDLARAKTEYAKSKTKDDNSVIAAQERLRDAQERVADLGIEQQDRIARAQERVVTARERQSDLQNSQITRLKDINERYADTVENVNNRVTRSIRDTNESVVRTYRDQQEVIAKAGVHFTDIQDKSEIDVKGFQAALQDLGLTQADVTDSQGKLTEQGFDKVADSVAKLPDSFRKTNDVMRIFGKGGADLIPLLDLGAKGLKETSAEADKLGLTLSADNLEKIHQYAEAHNRLKQALAGVEVDIGLKLMPTLTKWANWFTENQPAIKAWIDTTLVKIGAVLDYLEPALETFVNGWIKIIDYMAKHQDVLLVVGVALAALVTILFPVPATILAISYALAYMADNGWFDAIEKGFGQIVDAATGAVDYLKALPGKIADFARDAADSAYQFGIDIVNGIIDGIKSSPDIIKDALSDLIPGALKGKVDFLGLGNINPLHHAAGVGYIAHDELAILHRGETVRNAAETRSDMRGGLAGGIHVHFNGPTTLSGPSLASAAGDVGFAIAQQLRDQGFAL